MLKYWTWHLFDFSKFFSFEYVIERYFPSALITAGIVQPRRVDVVADSKPISLVFRPEHEVGSVAETVVDASVKGCVCGQVLVKNISGLASDDDFPIGSLKRSHQHRINVQIFVRFLLGGESQHRFYIHLRLLIVKNRLVGAIQMRYAESHLIRSPISGLVNPCASRRNVCEKEVALRELLTVCKIGVVAAVYKLLVKIEFGVSDVPLGGAKLDSCGHKVVVSSVDGFYVRKGEVELCGPEMRIPRNIAVCGDPHSKEILLVWSFCDGKIIGS